MFWLARYDIETKARTWYHLERSAWSVHFNISPDGTLLAGDGGGPAQRRQLDAEPRAARPARQRPVDLSVPAGARSR